jgi:ribosomal-protein-alanine N-acetyltransferase
MEAGDIPRVVAIDRLSFPTPWPSSSYLYELRNNRRSFYYVLLRSEDETQAPTNTWKRLLERAVGLCDDSRVIGYVGFRLRRDNTGAHISTIAVHPDWRGRGLGELLLLTVMERSMALGIDAVSLEVRASNKPAQHLYRKYGFRFKGVQKRYYQDGEDAWMLEVSIDPDTYPAQLSALRRALEGRICAEQPPVGQ